MNLLRRLSRGSFSEPTPPPAKEAAATPGKAPAKGAAGSVIKELDAVWVKLKATDSWAVAQMGEVVAPPTEGPKASVKVTVDGKEIEVPRAQVELACRGQENSDDIAELSSLNEPSLLELVKTRYEAKSIYTRAGPVLVAVNPYTDVSQLYAAEVRETYRHAASVSDGSVPPHVYETAARAFQSLIKGKAQSIIINGESGAGKTETTKILLTYLTSAANRGEGSVRGSASDSIAKTLINQVIASSPALETFGNAKTLRNDNSSRFGKFIKLHFTEGGELRYASIEHYLLEKSRVTTQQKGEQGYHAFYFLVAAAKAGEKSGSSLWPKLGLDGSNKSFKIMQPSEFGDAKLVEGFVEAQGALDTLFGGDTALRDAFWLATGGLLHFGQIDFEQKPTANDEEVSQVAESSKAAVAEAARLWGCAPEAIGAALCTRRIQAGSEGRIEIVKSVAQAAGSRDSLAKAVFALLFDRLLQEVNRALQSTDSGGGGGGAAGKKELFIGLLDIFGSEVFAVNGFEQLLINYANDKLQHFFTQTAIGVVAKLYASEGISIAGLAEEQDRMLPTLTMLEGGPSSKICLLSLLNDESYAQSSDETFVSKLHIEVGKLVTKGVAGGFISRDDGRKQGLIRKQESFGVVHFGATVAYTAVGFLDKNYDLLEDELVQLIQSSSNTFMVSLFGEAASKKRTVGAKFRDDMHKLVGTLNASEGHFVRCIKPNEQKAAFVMEPAMTLDQLKCCGVLEAARVTQAGYPTRMLFREFYEKYAFGPIRLGARRAQLGRQRSETLMSPEGASPVPGAARDRMGELKARVHELATKIFHLNPEKDMALGKTRIFLQRNVLTECERIHARLVRLRATLTRVYFRRLALRKWWKAVEILADEGKRAAYEAELAAQEAARAEAAREAERRREEEVAERVRLAAEEARLTVLSEQQEVAEALRREAEDAARAAEAEAAKLLAAHKLELATQLDEAMAKAAAEREAALKKAEEAKAAAVAETEAKAAEKAAALVSAAQREAGEATAAQLAEERAKAAKQHAEDMAAVKADAADDKQAALESMRLATLVEAGEKHAEELRAALAKAAEEKAAALKAAEAKAAEDKAAALAAAKAAAEQEKAAALESLRTATLVEAGEKAAAELKAALQQAAEEKAAALAAAEAKAAEEKSAALAAAKQEAAAEREQAVLAATTSTGSEVAAQMQAALAAARQDAAAALAAAEAKAAEDKASALTAARQEAAAEREKAVLAATASTGAEGATQMQNALRAAAEEKEAALKAADAKAAEDKAAALAAAAQAAATELAAAVEAENAATSAKERSVAAANLEAAMNTAAEEKAAALAAAEAKAAEEKAAALAAAAQAAATELASAVEAANTSTSAKERSIAASNLEAAMNTAAEEKAAALAAAEAKAAEEKAAALAAVKQQAAVELAAAVDATSAAVTAKEQSIAAAMVEEVMKKDDEEKHEALAAAALRAEEEKQDAVSAGRQEATAEAQAIAAQHLETALRTAAETKAAALKALDEQLTSSYEGKLSLAAEKAAGELARAMANAAQHEAEALQEAASVAAKERADMRQEALDTKRDEVNAAKQAGAEALTAAREAAAAKLTSELAEAARTARADKEEALAAAAAKAKAEREAAAQAAAEQLKQELGAAEAAHMNELDELTAEHEALVEKLKEDFEAKLAERAAQLQAGEDELEQARQEHASKVTKYEQDLLHVAREARKLRTAQRYLENDQRQADAERYALIQGVAIELIDAIRLYKEMRKKKRHTINLHLGSSSSEWAKDLGTTFSGKGFSLESRADDLAYEKGGAAASLEARPLLLQARVFYKAGAYIGRTFDAHMRAIKCLEALGNHEQARTEYKQILEMDDAAIEAAKAKKEGGEDKLGKLPGMKSKSDKGRRGSKMASGLDRAISLAPGRMASSMSSSAGPRLSGVDAAVSGGGLDDDEEEEASLLDERLNEAQRRELEAAIDNVDKILAEKYRAEQEAAAAGDVTLARAKAKGVQELAKVLASRKESAALGELGTLGPLSLARMDMTSIGFAKQPNTPQYTVNLSMPKLAPLRAFPFIGNTGTLTPWAPITMDKRERELADIPSHATHVAWAYPLPGVADVEKLEELVADAPPGMGLVLNGGFVYASSLSSPPCAVLAVLAARGGQTPRDTSLYLKFDGPHKLPDGARSALEMKSRFMPPTEMEHIRDGVIGYAWVEPTEGEADPLHWSNAGGVVDTKHGAFVFVYDDARHDRLFRRLSDKNADSTKSRKGSLEKGQSTAGFV